MIGQCCDSDRKEYEIGTLWNARESYRLCPWHCPEAHIVLGQSNAFFLPKSVITYAPQINMEIPPMLTIKDKQVRDHISQNGCKNIDKFLKPILDKWREVEVNIVVTGDTGAGKSSFINALLR